MEIINRIIDLLRQAGLLSSDMLRWIFIALGVLILFFAIYRLYKTYTQRKRVQSPPTLETPSPPTPKKEEKKEQAKSAQVLDKAFRNLLKKLHKHVVGKHIRAHIAGRSDLYQIPWIMMIGESGSGKSTVLSYTPLNLPFGFPKQPSAHGCDAWLFDRGIVLDIRGQYILQNDAIHSDEKGWRILLSLLRKYRPHCPIDSIVLTFSCQSLLDSQLERATKKADYLYHKLWQAQKELGIRFPISILITQCDRLVGFDSFCATLPESLQQNIFGWSNPYNLDKVYEPALIEEAFREMYSYLNELQIELVTVNDTIAHKDEFLLFPHQFRTLFKQLQIYLDGLFQPSVFSEPFFLRGIYFCGYGQTVSSQQDLPSHPPEISLDYHITGKDELKIEEDEFELIGEKPEAQVFFLEHLFRDKLFRESDLARPVLEALTKQKQSLRIKQAIAVVATTGMFLGQWWDARRLEQYQRAVLPMLEELAVDFERVQTAQITGDSNLDKLQLQAAENLLKNMSQVRSESLFSFFLPVSWISHTDEKVVRALSLGYDRFFLKWLYQKLFEKADNLLFFYTKEENLTTNLLQDSTFAANNKEFKLLSNFLLSFQELQEKIDIYNTLNRTDQQVDEERIVRVSALIKYLGEGSELNFSNWRLYGKILSSFHITQFIQFDLSEKVQKVNDILRGLMIKWFDYLFKENILFAEVKKLTEKLDGLEMIRERRPWLNNFFETIEQIERVENFLGRNSEWNWLAKSDVEFLEPHFLSLLNHIVETPFLSDLKGELQSVGNERYRAFRRELLTFTSRMTQGPLLVTQVDKIKSEEKSPALKVPTGKLKNQVLTNVVQNTKTEERFFLELANVLVELKQAVRSLNQESFMEPIETEQTLRVFPRDTDLLQRAVSLTGYFEKYKESKLAKVGQTFQEWLRKAAEIRHYENMKSLIIKAQPTENQLFAFEESQGSNIQNEKRIHGEVNNLFKVTSLLEAVFKPFAELKILRDAQETIQDNLRQLMTDRAYELLKQVDHLLEYDLYVPRDSRFSGWEGGPSPLEAFEVKDREEAKYYLSLERNRIDYLIENYIQPLMTSLTKQQGQWGNNDVLLKKWERILQEVDKYKAQKGDSSLTELEKFILFGLDQITLENCEEMTYYERTSADYFIDKLQNLKDALFQRCQALVVGQVDERYRFIKEAFDKELAGRFPFITLTDNTFLDEVTPEAIQKFFSVYTMYNPNLVDFLKYSRAFGASRDRAIQFLKQIEEVKVFFDNFLQESLPLKNPLYEVYPEFRVNQDYEIGANQIIDWKVEIGDKVLTYPSGGEPTSVRWELGTPLRVSFRWARNSAFRPYWDEDLSKTTMTLIGDDSTAVFQYNSVWSLLELLRRQQSQPADFLRGKDEHPYTLKFIIPIKELLANRQVVTERRRSELFLKQRGSYLYKDGKRIRQPENPFVQNKVPQVITSDRSQSIPYQNQDREQFEKRSQAVVFMRFVLTFPDKKEQLTLPEFPTQAPRLERPKLEEKEILPVRRKPPVKPPTKPTSPPPSPPPQSPPEAKPPSASPPAPAKPG